MSYKSKFPSSQNELYQADDALSRTSKSQGPSKDNLFADNFELKIDYKPEQAFDFEDYKQKIILIMEVFVNMLVGNSE